MRWQSGASAPYSALITSYLASGRQTACGRKPPNHPFPSPGLDILKSFEAYRPRTERNERRSIALSGAFSLVGTRAESVFHHKVKKEKEVLATNISKIRGLRTAQVETWPSR